jgi:uncharacterized protein YciU (UPF0263 family)
VVIMMVDQDRLQQVKVLAFNLYLTKQRAVSVFECIRAVSRECRVHINRKTADVIVNQKDQGEGEMRQVLPR